MLSATLLAAGQLLLALSSALPLAVLGRVLVGVGDAIVFVAVLVWLSRRLTEPLGTALGRLRSADRRLAIAVYLTFAAPLLVVAYALVGGLIPLIAAMAVAAVAELVLVSRR